MSENTWPYPGSRWWKFDFHVHTPASKDTGLWQQAIGTADEVTPEKWLLQFMTAEIDCVAVTDHNSGAWIDTLKQAYQQMKDRAEKGQLAEGFRPLTIFPGVEISANGGVHVLAIFDPSASTSDIDRLLGAVGYQGTKGDSDSETNKSVAEVIKIILDNHAIPIPAHADREKGLLRVKLGTKQSVISPGTVQQALEVEELLAVEWCDPNNPYPEHVEKLAMSRARVLGSDCHSFQGSKKPGQFFTWVKMARPTLEGLRLALLDGNGVSIRRSDDGVGFDPARTPAHFIRAIEVDKARFMGNGRPARLEFSPYFNAIVGGRGTGKSTVVHALRLATRREDEIIQGLPTDSEPHERFKAFCAIAKGRDDKGGLKPDTVIHVEWQDDDTQLRLNWYAAADKTASVEEWRDGNWQASASQSVNKERFPLRILSQGQIAEMAGDGRQTLLGIIDEAAKVAPLKQAYAQAQQTFLAQRARLRELDGKLAQLSEVTRRLGEVETKLDKLAQSDHAAVMQAYARAHHQNRIVEATLSQLRECAVMLRRTVDRLLIDDWPHQHFTEADADLLAWRADADSLLSGMRQRLEKEVTALDQGILRLNEDTRLASWRTRADDAHQRYEELQKRLAGQGVADPQAFARLTQERQLLETQRKELVQNQADRERLLQQIDAQKQLILQKRRAMTESRQAFLADKLANNDYVRITVKPFGFDPLVVERSLRELIDVRDERFADDILEITDGEAKSGLAFDIASAPENQKLSSIERVRQTLLQRSETLGGHFRNYLGRRWDKPELADYVEIWFPEDDLYIDYQRDHEWYPISQGSQGQRSAALLAFLLAFGGEPLVLDQPEDDLDNHLIYDLIVRQIRENKLRRQLIVVTHNPNVVVNGDAELVHAMDFSYGQCFVRQSGALQEKAVREEVCRVMEGGREAFARRWKRLGKEI